MSTETDLASSLQGRYACCVIQNQEYGVRTAQVRTIGALPMIRKVPKAPSFVAGVANLGGRIVPILDPVERFGLPSTPDAAPTRCLMVQLENSVYGIIVEGVSNVTQIPADAIEPINPLLIAHETQFLNGMAKNADNLIYLLDLEAFVRFGVTVDQRAREAYERFSFKMSAALERPQIDKFERFLCLVVGDEEYGVRTTHLKEVIRTDKMEPITGGPKFLSGIVKKRDNVFPVIDLQKKLGLDSYDYTKESRIVLLDTGRGCYGILANSITEILHVTEKEIRQTDTIMSGPDSSHIKGVAMLEGGARLVVLLNDMKILGDEDMKRLAKMDEINMSMEERKPEAQAEKDQITFVIFKVADIEMAIRSKDISEVIKYRKPTRIPKSPPFVKGIVSAKGQLVSVLDLRLRFDLESRKADVETRMILVKKEDRLVAIPADTVSEIRTVNTQELVEAPEIVKGIDSNFLEGLIPIKDTDRAPIILNLDAILKAS